MADINLAGPNTGASLSAQVTPRMLWDRAVQIYEREEDPFMYLEGGSDAIVETKTDTAAGAGSKIKYNVTSEFGDDPKLGDELFEVGDDFEEIMLGEFELAVDWVRHATRWTKRGIEIMGMSGELTRGVPKRLGQLLGKTKSHMLQMMFLHHSNANNHFYTGLSEDAIVMGDQMTYDEIIKGGAILQPLGATPARIGKDKEGNPIWGACVIGTNNAIYGLKQDPVYRANLQNGMDRGASNLLFSGGVTNIDGHLIKEYTPKRGDIEGAVGSPLNPQALLGEAITNGTGTFFIKGGGKPSSAAKTKKKYYKYFPKYGFRWSPSMVLSTTSKVCWNQRALGWDGSTADVFYVRIQNPPNAAVDPGKWAIYEISANDGNKLTVSGRLHTADGSGGADIRRQTIGGVTWDGAKHTKDHAAGSLVVLCNRLGVPLGASLVLYRQAAYRGYGSVRNQRQEDSHNGGFVQERYIEGVFGQCLREDVNKNKPGVAIMKHAIYYPGYIEA